VPKTIIITGASSGFGAMTARVLAEAGHVVYVGMRDVAGSDREAAQEHHAWLLDALDEGTHVVMEEIGLGDTAENLVATSSGHKPRGHDLWNVSLKFLCKAEHVSPHRADAHCDRPQIAR
jgi:NAD(P)-dependent dehydrogenase (short-subunit alcohol dehydrogenase family)